jgi:cyclophilin family peptidyl-prolyl cis-trans isomerase/HEAT repeat protein
VNRLFLFAALLIVCVACDQKKSIFEDKDIRHIADLQDRRKTDSLLIYLSSDNVEHRKRAALAFASVQDTAAITDLSEVADTEAVFALGQMYAPGSRYALKESIGRGNAMSIRREAFEALGKVVRKEDAGLLRDSTRAEGVAWGIYRAGLRGLTDSILVREAASILSDINSTRDDRLAAAHFFSRVQFKEQPAVASAIIRAAADDDIEIRMAAVNALSKLSDVDAIKKAIDDPDYRVRVNAGRALRTKPWDIAKPLFGRLLNDENANVSITVAEVVLNIPAADTATIHQWAKAAGNWRTQATLYSKLHADKETRSIYAKSNNNYQKAALLKTMSDPAFIFDEYKKNDAKVVKSTAAFALAHITSDLEIFKQIIADGDQGSIIPICDALRDTTRGFKRTITDHSFLEQAKSKLSLPRDYETYAPLEETLNYLKGVPPPAPLKNEYNHPIDWALALTIPKDQRVRVKTSKGDIVMQLFIEEAPGSVVNFVKLVNSGYFNDRYFHRVVPNFVVQTGCNRGDGFGSEDYSIRSEFSQRKYKTGSVGMASAGKDTEGTQWFITHSPTPHLDGKYSIFAEVISGMDVVHKIEVGDKILEAVLVKD